MKIRDLTEDEVEFEVEAEPEYIAPEGCFASGDDEADAEMCKQIRKDAEWNEWAWCCVKVTARWKGYKAVDYLGACSYESKEDFMQPGGYFDSMKHEALTALNKNLKLSIATLSELEVPEAQP